jgi:hypothetical protein
MFDALFARLLYVGDNLLHLDQSQCRLASQGGSPEPHLSFALSSPERGGHNVSHLNCVAMLVANDGGAHPCVVQMERSWIILYMTAMTSLSTNPIDIAPAPH